MDANKKGEGKEEKEGEGTAGERVERRVKEEREIKEEARVERTEVLIIGGGFAGSYCARHLERKYRVTLIDSKDYFEFTPGVLRTLVEPEHISKIEIQHVDHLKKARFIRGRVCELSARRAKILGEMGCEIEFEAAIIATGSHYVRPIKQENVVLADRARELSIQALRLKSARSVMVVGGGVVGVEMAAEIITHFPDKKVVVMHNGERVCERMPEKASRYAEEFLRKRGVEIVFNEKIERGRGRVFVAESGRRWVAEMVVWCTGIMPSGEFLKSLKEKRGGRGEGLRDSFSSVLSKEGGVVVNEFFQVKGFEDIFAVGDVTAITEEKLAQTAIEHAKIAVRNVAAVCDAKRAERTGRCEKVMAGGVESMGFKGGLRKYISSSRVMVISLGKYDGMMVWRGLVITGLIPGLLKGLIERVEMGKMKCYHWWSVFI